MKDLTKIYIDLSKLSAEEIIKIEDIIKYEISRINEYPFLIFSFDVWNQCGETSPLWGNKTGLTYPEFIKLFEGGERKEVLQVKKSKALSFILGQIDKKIEQINEIDIAHTEGVLIGLKICKELWAQGTISHESIQEEIYHYQEELDNLNSK